MNNMVKRIGISTQTRKNWLIDAAVFFGGLLAGLSAIYFLFLPSGGYRGGRNPMYGITLLFGRETWGDVHTWAGVAMIVAVAVHLAIHWSWVKMMGKRTANALLARGSQLSKGARLNVAVDASVAVSFLICALSGIYFLFDGVEGAHGSASNPVFLVSPLTWDLIHTWSGVVLMIAVIVHLVIHWRWVKNVTARFFLSLLPQPEVSQALAINQPVLANNGQM